MFGFLYRQLGHRIYWVAALSLFTGICNTLMIKTLNDVIQGGVDGSKIAVFAASIVGYLAASRVFNRMLLRATQKAVFDMRRDILRRVLDCDLQQFERVPNQLIYTAITEDTSEIARSPEILSSLLTASFTVLVCFGYLCWLSPTAFLTILISILVGGTLYTKVAGRAERDWHAARLTQDAFFRLVDHQLRGFKELKINDARRETFFEKDLLERCRESYQLNVRGGEKYIAAIIVSGLLIYGILGAFAFTGQTWLGLEQGPFAATILVMLYLTPAIQQTVDLLPTLARFGIAIDKVRDLQANLAEGSMVRSTTESPQMPKWNTLRLSGVTFEYPSRGDGEGETFAVGPIDLEVHRGETLFIVGGNGSGKTTLLKLLLGLYRPKSGQIWLDDSPLEPGSPLHRHLFAPLFADFHLFDRLYQRNEDLAVDDLLQQMGIAHKVHLAVDHWSTVDLSQGQRKRLGLVTALAQAAPVLVMDEFAADQDPGFRATFYREHLPAWRALGQTIVAITHDEAYFDAADRIIHMREGVAVEEDPATLAPVMASLR